MHGLLISLLNVCSIAMHCAAAQAPSPSHVTVYYEAGRYGGWPANHGIRRWGNENDGGQTWTVESRRTLTPAQKGGPAAQQLSKPMDFLAPDFAMQFRFGDNNRGPSWFYYSEDRCRTCKGPFKLPDFGRRGVSARTDYQVIDKSTCLIYLDCRFNQHRAARPTRGSSPLAAGEAGL